MPRVTLATLKRLDAVERSVLGDDGISRVGCMRVPRILPIDEWEAIAMTTQRALALAAAEDIDRRRDDHTSQFQHALPAAVPQHTGLHGYSVQTGVVAPVHRPKSPPLPPVSIR